MKRINVINLGFDRKIFVVYFDGVANAKRKKEKQNHPSRYVAQDRPSGKHGYTDQTTVVMEETVRKMAFLSTPQIITKAITINILSRMCKYLITKLALFSIIWLDLA